MVVGSHVKGPSVSKVQPIPENNIQYSKPSVNILSHKAKIQLQYCQKGLFKVGTLFTKKCTTRFIFTRSGATKFYIAVFSLENLFTDLPYFAPTCTSFYSVLDPDPDGSGLFRRSDFKTRGFKIRVLDVLHVRKGHIFSFYPEFM